MENSKTLVEQMPTEPTPDQKALIRSLLLSLYHEECARHQRVLAKDNGISIERINQILNKKDALSAVANWI